MVYGCHPTVQYQITAWIVSMVYLSDPRHRTSSILGFLGFGALEHALEQTSTPNPLGGNCFRETGVLEIEIPIGWFDRLVWRFEIAKTPLSKNPQTRLRKQFPSISSETVWNWWKLFAVQPSQHQLPQPTIPTMRLKLALEWGANGSHDLPGSDGEIGFAWRDFPCVMVPRKMVILHLRFGFPYKNHPFWAFPMVFPWFSHGVFFPMSGKPPHFLPQRSQIFPRFGSASLGLQGGCNLRAQRRRSGPSRMVEIFGDGKILHHSSIVPMTDPYVCYIYIYMLYIYIYLYGVT